MSEGVIIYRSPEENKDGYSEFSMWELMNIFGECLYMGNTKIPFEYNQIEFKEKD